MTKTAWVFPGQGSQAVGMGLNLAELPGAGVKFKQAEDILEWSVLELCQSEDKQLEEKLSETFYTQPCLYVIESILADLLLAQGRKPDLVAGHSLGEYVALYAAKVFDFTTGLKLVKRRAQLMSGTAGGKMVALIKFDREQLEKVISDTPDVVLANDNSALQAVISGTPEAVDTVVAQIKYKRAIPLKVSGAFHSHLMEPVAAEFAQVLDEYAFADAQVPVLSNVEPVPTVDADELKERLKQQMTGSVRWREIMLALPDNGINKAVEVGPGNVLTGLIKRTCKSLELENVQNASSFLALAT